MDMLRALVFRDGDWWIIQGLDYDFVTLARRLEDVPGEIQRWLSVMFEASRQLGIQPFNGYSPAPSRFWRMYEEAEPWTELTPTVAAVDDFAAPSVVQARLAA